MPPPSAHIEDYPSTLEEVVLKALKKEPSERFATAHEMLQALERAVPEALERSFDVTVAEFVAKVAGSSGAQRCWRLQTRTRPPASRVRTAPAATSQIFGWVKNADWSAPSATSAIS